MEKLSSADFTYTVAQEANRVAVVLNKLSTGQVQRFWKVDGHLKAYEMHMMTLTDDQCNQWFDPKKQGKKKK